MEPNRNLHTLLAAFQGQTHRINALLESMEAKLMPTAMPPWMNPSELSDAGPLVRRE
ncbi:hypothetical protein [Nitrosospira sp. Is2]|uniref:hypothetical protein n=1 Tax=Nitrosospira sp. Is2 TaxID=3080532 RepID=UPI00295482A2|nr:hypothetical protein [Nitrosospira sp. Is2]WON73160.1 hypothetical protein R5L00_11790 [Nitrosospira sp. Is2]